MSNQFRAMGRRIMRKHKILPSARKRHGIPFGKWTQIVVQMMEARAKKVVEARAKSVAEKLKEEAENG